MQAAEGAAGAPSTPESLERAVLEAVRELAGEVGGVRAAHAVALGASLEREVGLGSLERVELLSRLEKRLGRRLGDHLLEADSPAELARALSAAPGDAPAPKPERATAIEAATPLRTPAGTIHAALWRRAEEDPSRPHVYLREDDGGEQTVTYGRLLEAARSVAGGLHERGVRRGDRVALMLPTGFDFLRSFQGILAQGAIPVPIYPPARLDRIEEYALRQAAILRDAGARLLITIPRVRPVVALLKPQAPSLRDVISADELAAAGQPLAEPEGTGADPAFIQYTSGSTGHPKGVLLTHDNLLANMRAVAAALAMRPTDVVATWLPLYHDMGLIGAWLFSLVNGLPVDMQSPLSFLSRPERWLWAIHRRRATLSPAPNFAYELCVRRIPDAALEGLDLSSWRCALNGAEPVSPDTLERFARRFAPHGFRREAMLPVYGLAENSVAVCFPPPGRGPRIDRVRRAPFEQQGQAEPAEPGDTTALPFVSVGSALPEHEVRIVDEGGADLPERRVGRLLFRGPSMTPGYFRQPEATEAMTRPGGYYDSGDLAYVAEGETYIAGRSKDLIIKGGRNLVPHEIEEIVGALAGVRRGCVVAFGVRSESQGTELLAVVAETRARDPGAREEIERRVVEAVAEAVGLPPDVVALVPPGSVPKTSSGKVRRAATKELYLRGSLGRAPRTSLATRLRLARGAILDGVRPALGRLVQGLYALWLVASIVPAGLVAWAALVLVPTRSFTGFVQRHGARLLMRLLGCRMRVSGAAGLRGRGPFLLACNRTSYVDVPVILALVPLDLAFIAKQEVGGWPFVGLLLRRLGHVLVDRRHAQASVAAAARVAETVRAGRSVLVFPEATFTAAAGLRPFRLGAFKTAVETGTPVLPLALVGARRVLRDRAWLPRPGRIALWIGEPIAPTGGDWRAVVELRDRVAEAIAAHCGEPRLDLVAGGQPPRAPAA